MRADDSAPSEEEFDALMARSGLRVPEELRRGTLAGYRQLRRLADLLHTPMDPEDEPAAVYRMRMDGS